MLGGDLNKLFKLEDALVEQMLIAADCNWLMLTNAKLLRQFFDTLGELLKK